MRASRINKRIVQLMYDLCSDLLRLVLVDIAAGMSDGMVTLACSAMAMSGS